MRRLILFLYAIIFIWIISGFFRLFDYSDEFSNLVQGNFEFTNIFSVLNGLLLIYILYRLIKFEKVLNGIARTSLFSRKNGEAFNSLGKAFVWYSLFKFLIQIINTFLTELDNPDTAYSISYALGYDFGQAIASRFPLLIFGLFLLIIARLMMDGYELKKENDLTI